MNVKRDLEEYWNLFERLRAVSLWFEASVYYASVLKCVEIAPETASLRLSTAVHAVNFSQEELNAIAVALEAKCKDTTSKCDDGDPWTVEELVMILTEKVNYDLVAELLERFEIPVDRTPIKSLAAAIVELSQVPRTKQLISSAIFMLRRNGLPGVYESLK